MLEKKRLESSTKAALIGSIVAAIVTVIGTLRGIYLQNKLSLDHENQIELRQERKVAYSKFIDDANNYDEQTKTLKDCIISQKKEKTAASILTCPTALKLVNARYEFQGSINEMYTYGTPKAIAITDLIADTLPSAVATKSDENGIPPYDEIINYKGESFSVQYSVFLDIQCQDIRPGDTNICTEY